MKLFISTVSLLCLFSFKLNAQDDLQKAESKFKESQAALAKAIEEDGKTEEAPVDPKTSEKLTEQQQADLTKQIEEIKANSEKAEKMLEENK